MILRKAHIGDIEFLFSLRNEEAVRLASFISDPIDFGVHQKWFEKKNTDDNCAMFIAEIDSVSVGQVRFDIVDEKIAEVSIAISESFRGMGHGAGILKESSLLFFENFHDVQLISAFIKMDNYASIKSFSRAGYCYCEDIIKQGNTCVRMILKRKN